MVDTNPEENSGVPAAADDEATNTAVLPAATPDELKEMIGNRFVGRVKWFNNRMGYGFITLTQDSSLRPVRELDVFVHHSNIRPQRSNFRTLVQGEYVEFKLGECTDKKSAVQAEDITGPGGGPLMSDTRAANPRPNYRQEGDFSGGGGEEWYPVQRGGRGRGGRGGYGGEGGGRGRGSYSGYGHP